MKKLFEKFNIKYTGKTKRFNYINEKNLFTISYEDVVTNKKENLFNNLKMSI